MSASPERPLIAASTHPPSVSAESVPPTSVLRSPMSHSSRTPHLPMQHAHPMMVFNNVSNSTFNFCHHSEPTTSRLQRQSSTAAVSEHSTAAESPGQTAQQSSGTQASHASQAGASPTVVESGNVKGRDRYCCSELTATKDLTEVEFEAELPPAVVEAPANTPALVDLDASPSDKVSTESGPPPGDHRQAHQAQFQASGACQTPSRKRKRPRFLERNPSDFITRTLFETAGKEWYPFNLLVDSGSRINLIAHRDLVALGLEGQLVRHQGLPESFMAIDGQDIETMGTVALHWKGRRRRFWMWELPASKVHRDVFYVVEDIAGALTEILLGAPSLSRLSRAKLRVFTSKGKRFFFPETQKEALPSPTNTQSSTAKDGEEIKKPIENGQVAQGKKSKNGRKGPK